MSMTVASHVNLDTLNQLDANKTYFLSSTTGQVKEASLWMRFKCAIGVSSARQKVANLVDAIKASLLTAAGQTGNATLDTDIKTIDLKSMVKGSVIKDIAKRFSVANSETMLRNEAAKVARQVGTQVAATLAVRLFGIGRTEVVGSIVQHALKPLADDIENLPMRNGALDKELLALKMTVAADEAEKLIKSIANDQRLGIANIDKHYAKHIIDTLFNKDGTRNENTVDDLKTPIQVKVDIAFKFGVEENASFQHGARETLISKGIDPEKKVADILQLCGGDKELEELVLNKVPELCVNSNQFLRTEEKTKAMVNNIKEAMAEMREVAKDFPGCSNSLKSAVELLGSSPIPKGLFRRIANIVQDAKLDKFASLNCTSSAFQIYEGLEQVRLLVDRMIQEIDVIKTFEDAGEEEAGGPHMNAARAITISLALAKAGPGLTARMPNIINGTEFQKMSSAMSCMLNDLNDGMVIPGVNSNAIGKEVLERQGITSSFLQGCVGEALEIEIPEVPDIKIDPQEDSIGYMVNLLSKAVDEAT